MSHVCTNESFVAGGEEIELTCNICLVKSIQKIGYMGGLCTNCNHLGVDSEYAYLAVYFRRTYLGLTRKQMAELTGYSKNTIKNYEFGKCTKKYLDKTTEIIKAKMDVK